MKILFITIILIFVSSIQIDASEREAQEWEQRAFDHCDKKEYSRAIDAYVMASMIYRDLRLGTKVIEIAEKQAIIHEQQVNDYHIKGFRHLEIDSYKHAAICYKKAGNIIKVAEIFEKMASLLLQELEGLCLLEIDI